LALTHIAGISWHGIAPLNLPLVYRDRAQLPTGFGTFLPFAFNMDNGSYSLKSDNERGAAAARRSARPPLLRAAGSSFSPLGGSHL